MIKFYFRAELTRREGRQFFVSCFKVKEGSEHVVCQAGQYIGTAGMQK